MPADTCLDAKPAARQGSGKPILPINLNSYVVYIDPRDKLEIKHRQLRTLEKGNAD